MLAEPEIVRMILRERVEILSYIDSFLNDAHLSEDCFQDVCVAAVVKRDFFEDATHVIRWSLRVARNKAIDLARRRSRQPVVLDEDVLELLEGRWVEGLAPGSLDLAVRVEALQTCLDGLTDYSRRIIDLRYVDGLKSSRIAELLGREVESVYRALTRTHVALRECMHRKLAAEME